VELQKGKRLVDQRNENGISKKAGKKGVTQSGAIGKESGFSRKKGKIYNII